MINWAPRARIDGVRVANAVDFEEVAIVSRGRHRLVIASTGVQ